ncbi:MAG: hypothetical protein CVV59_01945, partial [Tenericutes bacterium HGW-Tenericutes-4]
YANKNDIEAIYQICNEQLGKEYIKVETVKKLLNYKNSIIKVFEENNEVAAFIVLEIISKSRLKTELRTIEEPLLTQIKNETKFGFLNIVAVLNKFMGKKIGSALTFDAVEEIKNRQIKNTFSLAWKDKEKINIGNILLRAGFNLLYEVKNYYYKESIEKQYNCPNCGAPPCKCSAVIYNYNLKTKE